MHRPKHLKILSGIFAFNAISFLKLCFLFFFAVDIQASEYEIIQPQSDTQTPVSERSYQLASQGVGRLANWIDSFFDDPTYLQEYASGRVRLRQTGDYRVFSNNQYRTRVDGSITLPRAKESTRLFFSGSDDSSLDNNNQETFDDSTAEAIDRPSLGLQFGLQNLGKLDFRFSAGLRLNESTFFLGPRMRWTFETGKQTQVRVTQRFRWYHREGWRSYSDLDIDRKMENGLLFRQNFTTTWQEDNFRSEGFRHAVDTSFTQPLSANDAIRVGVLSVFLSKIDKSWQFTELFGAYRKLYWQNRVALDVTPFLAWEEARGGNINPGIRLGLSLTVEGGD